MPKLTLYFEQPTRGFNTLKVTLENNTNKSLRLLKWQTPFDSIFNNNLLIERNDSEASCFIGVQAKRTYIFEHSTIYIAAKNSVSCEIKIDDSWHIGAYAVHSINLAHKYFEICEVKDEAEFVNEDDFIKTPVKSLTAKAILKPIVKETPLEQDDTVRYEDISLDQFEDELLTAGPVCPTYALCLPPSYTNGGECIWNRYLGYPKIINQQNNDRGVIKQYVNMHEACFQHSINWYPKKWDFHKDPIYKKWFGAYNKSRALQVAKTLRSICSIKSCINFHIFFDWTDGDVIAYWRPSNNPKELNVLGLTRLYFSSPTSGTDSKLGTLAHEFSHAYQNTSDIAYGQSKCLKLAKSNPDNAIRNADSYQYYLEEKVKF